MYITEQAAKIIAENRKNKINETKNLLNELSTKVENLRKEKFDLIDQINKIKYYFKDWDSQDDDINNIIKQCRDLLFKIN